ncbi:uncharacterized protein PITG_00377 [Phytophthora infestans T30-4]|uniref:Uncharacterized protein n=1 Tax=Phytophthora infestans (strain T30-4) TaxID=403677 RepID=D0MQM6_PHYIT|nr:uncharacterized protein PITG_00377 [Phytophthora infestans T30-4]EEY57795.1 hypothetical protein PITG_00377 [Phytophthora infestans T30-4]|eukprot:XP_002908981.1 hypothetical protein PITG_00377 [Phytophthora infestans T30-4]
MASQYKRELTRQPAFRRDVITQDITTSPPNPPPTRRASTAVLSKRPKDLFKLWHEYQVGCGDLKAAKDFTAIERGASKFAFSRRKVFWDVVASLDDHWHGHVPNSYEAVAIPDSDPHKKKPKKRLKDDDSDTKTAES